MIYFIIIVFVLTILLGFEPKEKDSDLPPFTKNDTDKYYSDFDNWNKY